MTQSTPTNRWKRYDVWDERPLSFDRFAPDSPQDGFRAANGPTDPKPSLVLDEGKVVEMDGVAEAGFDMVDEFIARHHVDPEIAAEAMAIDSAGFARRLVDVNKVYMTQ